MNPANRAAQVVGAISVVRSAHAEAQRFSTELSKAPHTLELGLAPSQNTQLEADLPESENLIEVETPGELSERILRALFGQWPQK
jgi:hypothetical protein